MTEENPLKNKLIEYYEESKENINFKSQLILSLVQSIKEENNQFFSKSKFPKYITKI
jgi:hypothetical protein